jgi:hypothetical protein
MTSTPIELGALLDIWSMSGRVRLVETPLAVTVSRLDAASTRVLIAAVEELGWAYDLQDQAAEPAHLAHIDDDFGPFVATVRKAVDGADRRLLTKLGLKQALEEKNTNGVWQIACSNTPFATGTTSFNPWGGGDVFAPAATTKSPLDIVREANEARLVPADIRKWLLRGEMTETLWRDEAFLIFAAASAPALLRSLASEALGSAEVVFNGPPRLTLAFSDDELLRELELDGYRNLRAAVAWVYEDPSSAEQRHALFTAEFARSVTRGESIGRAFHSAGRDILDGSRLAFQLSQSELSREAIKAQGDLRKAIADDTSKAAEGTRTLSGAIAVAIATGITLIAARSTGNAEPWVLSLIAGVVAGYLFVVAVSGWAHLRVQRRLREQWRHRLYRFVPADDYEAMVLRPARSAERPYHFVGAIALAVAMALTCMSVGLWLEPSPRKDAAPKDQSKADEYSTPTPDTSGSGP